MSNRCRKCACGVVALLVLFLLPTTTTAQPGGGGGSGQVCTFSQHWNQLPTPLQQCYLTHSVDFDVKYDEGYTLVVDTWEVAATCEFVGVCSDTIPCDYQNPTFACSQSISREKSYGVSGGASVAIKGEVGINVIAKVGIETSFFVQGEWSRSETVTDTAGMQKQQEDCNTYQYDIERQRLVATGYVDYYSQVYTWYLDESYGCPPTYETTCGDNRVTGDSTHHPGWRIGQTRIIPCPPPCGRLCDP